MGEIIRTTTERAGGVLFMTVFPYRLDRAHDEVSILRCSNSKLKSKTRTEDTEYIVIYTRGEQGAMGIT